MMDMEMNADLDGVSKYLYMCFKHTHTHTYVFYTEKWYLVSLLLIYIV